MIGPFARFGAWRDRDVLEVGVGAGSDHLQFARAGARCAGVDLTDAAIELTTRRLAAEGLSSRLLRSDAEALPFADASFDFVFSWGVIHHTPNTERAAQEILRVLRPGGRFCVMVYNSCSLVALQSWLYFGVLRGRPLRSIQEILAEHMESPGTKAYTKDGARALFAGARDAAVDTVVTSWDARIGRRRFLPKAFQRLIPERLGWFHVVTGER